MVDLSKGLAIENLDLLIPWGITNEEAWRIGFPKPFNLPDDKTRMIWDNAVILDGIDCTIQTWFQTPKSGLSQFNIMDAGVEQHFPKIWENRLRTQCEKLFGQQTENQVWRQKNITLKICHDDRFVEAYWLQIMREAS